MNRKTLPVSLLFLVFSILLAYREPQNAFATTITVGSPQLVVPNSAIYPITIPYTGESRRLIDAPVTTFVSGGQRYWFNSDGSAHTKYQGLAIEPFKTRIWTKPSEILFKDPKNLGLGGPWRRLSGNNWTYDGAAPWIVNLYQASDRELLAFLHLEQGYATNGQYAHDISSIGLAWSNDAGESFTYLGNIIKYDQNITSYNIQGAPYFIKDGYFYVYYKDKCPTQNRESVARASVSQVVSAARLGNSVPWKKYYQGGWTSDALGGLCTGVSIQSGIDHTDAAYSTHTGKYYMLLSQNAVNGSETWIKLFESTDGISWIFVDYIVREPFTTEKNGYQYVTILGSTGSDNSIVGKSFLVYSGRNKPNPSLYRWLVTINDPPSTTIIPVSPSTSPSSPTPVKIPGDLTDTGDTTGDQVNIFDYNLLVSNFGNPYTIFDYNTLLSNFGL